VDLYNEGVDIPEVDTLLLLRPTQSPVLFQQQIGRGLRLVPGKESCLVLDFVGLHDVRFRFDRLLATLTGLGRRGLAQAVAHGFADLPPGCHVHLERRTRQQVLHNLQVLTQQTWARLRAELQAFAQMHGAGEVTLGEFLHEQMIDPGEVYRASGRSGWTTLRRDAGLLPGEGSDAEARLSKRIGALLHADDPDYLRAVHDLAAGAASGATATGEADARAQMLTYQLLLERTATPAAALRERLAEHPHCAAELREVAELLLARSRVDPIPLPGAEDLPLRLHASYGIREILTAAGFLTPEQYVPFQAGVLPLRERRMELLFVTLDKSAGFHDRIAYQDYAVSPARFHWQTQNAAGPDTPGGRRYLESPGNGWTFQLFVRTRKDEPYRACGPVHLADPFDVTGARPMNVTWTLGVPLPPRLFSEFSVLRG
jgi:hypothetical protein